MSQGNGNPSVFEQACELIKAATGEEYGDGETVTEVLSGYAEPGYGPDDAVVVLGNWNPRRVAGIDDYWHSDDPRVTWPVKLADALVEAGAEIEWFDEWAECQGCFKAVRTQPDSYSWKPSYGFTEYGLFCHKCQKAGER